MDWKSKRVGTILEAALAEDKVANDITTALTIPPNLRASGTIIAKQACVVSGLGCIPVFLDIFAKMSITPVGRFEVVSHSEIFDGVKVKKGQTLAVIRHNAAALLSCERVILNLMQRMSGIATLTNEFVKAVANTKTKVLDTRKTIPGLRALDKYAVCCSGGVNHRLDLQDGILIKNNHISLGGGLPTVLEHAHHRGHLLRDNLPDLFDLPSVAAALANTAFALNLQHFPSVGSTNVLALEAAQSGAAHGSVWVADEQTTGRGRSDHEWHSPAGDGLYVSVLLRPQMALADALWLSLATALAVRAAIATVTGLRPDIRWPNDLLIGNKKCGGILVETSAVALQPETPAMLRHAVVGVGINANQQSFPPELEALATSLLRESGKRWAREPILVEFLRALDNEIAWLE